MLARIVGGRTDLVFAYVAAGNPASATDKNGVPLIVWCAYYGDASAVRFLLANGAPLSALGDDLGLNAAAFHGHWRLCQFLIEQGANVNLPLHDTGETPLHAALCAADRPATGHVVQVLLGSGASPHCCTKPGVATGAFMRDARTRAETPLHRAAAFASGATIQMLLNAGAKRDAKDMNGDSPLSWASWHLRPDPILQMLCYDDFSIHPDRHGLEPALLGYPHATHTD